MQYHAHVDAMNCELRREHVLSTLRRIKPRLVQEYGLVRIGIFGSLARGDAGPDSDIDIVVDIAVTAGFRYIRMLDEIEQELGSSPVDFVRLRPDLHPTLRKNLETDAVYV